MRQGSTDLFLKSIAKKPLGMDQNESYVSFPQLTVDRKVKQNREREQDSM